MPSPSSARSRSASVRGLIPQQDRSSCENRRGPSERSWTSRAVHFAPMISAEAATPQAVDSWTACIVRLICRLYVPPPDVASLGDPGSAPGGEGREHAEVESGQEEISIVIAGGGHRRVDGGSVRQLRAARAVLGGERRRAGVDLRDREAGDRPEALGRLARLRDSRVAGDRQEDERVLHREAVLV